MDIRRIEVEAQLDAAEEKAEERVEELSPSGAYRLVIRSYYAAASGFSRGTVTRVADGGEVCDIKRNHPGFHHAFVSVDGREYLIAGRTFLSQTIVDLASGDEYTSPGDPFDGSEFCWANATLSPDGTTLAVDGCILGQPFEYRFFDFTNPASGWRRLAVEKLALVPALDGKLPEWRAPATFESYQCRPDAAGKLEVALTIRVAREGDHMVIAEWREADEHAAADALWHAFFTSDPMYLAMQQAIREHKLPATGGAPTGKQIVRFFRRQAPQASADLIWDLDEQIVIKTVDAGGDRRETTFPHTIAGMVDAIAGIAAAFKY